MGIEPMTTATEDLDREARRARLRHGLSMQTLALALLAISAAAWLGLFMPYASEPEWHVIAGSAFALAGAGFFAAGMGLRRQKPWALRLIAALSWPALALDLMALLAVVTAGVIGARGFSIDLADIAAAASDSAFPSKTLLFPFAAVVVIFWAALVITLAHTARLIVGWLRYVKTRSARNGTDAAGGDTESRPPDGSE